MTSTRPELNNLNTEPTIESIQLQLAKIAAQLKAMQRSVKYSPTKETR